VSGRIDKSLLLQFEIPQTSTLDNLFRYGCAACPASGEEHYKLVASLRRSRLDAKTLGTRRKLGYPTRFLGEATNNIAQLRKVPVRNMRTLVRRAKLINVVRNYKFTESHINTDMLGLMQQLGVFPTPRQGD
jgi:hypothetical protein